MRSKKKKKKNQKEIEFDCSSCENCIYIGEGDHICDINNKVIYENKDVV